MVDAVHVAKDLETVILTEEQILARVAVLAGELHERYGDAVPVIVGVLGGAATFTVDLARAYPAPADVAWMAIKSYSTRNRASGSVRLLKDLDVDISGRDVIIVDGVIDTGLTMNWLISSLAQRAPRSIAVCALLRKPDVAGFGDTPTHIGFDVDDGLIVGYGLDYNGKYRNLRCAAVLAKKAFE
jgi:hypoxanthine phosphoribosyltransferase